MSPESRKTVIVSQQTHAYLKEIVRLAELFGDQDSKSRFGYINSTADWAVLSMFRTVVGEIDANLRMLHFVNPHLLEASGYEPISQSAPDNPDSPAGKDGPDPHPSTGLADTDSD